MELFGSWHQVATWVWMNWSNPGLWSSSSLYLSLALGDQTLGFICLTSNAVFLPMFGTLLTSWVWVKTPSMAVDQQETSQKSVSKEHPNEPSTRWHQATPLEERPRGWQVQRSAPPIRGKLVRRAASMTCILCRNPGRNYHKNVQKITHVSKGSAVCHHQRSTSGRVVCFICWACCPWSSMKQSNVVELCFMVLFSIMFQRVFGPNEDLSTADRVLVWWFITVLYGSLLVGLIWSVLFVWFGWLDLVCFHMRSSSFGWFHGGCAVLFDVSVHFSRELLRCLVVL